MEYGGTAVFSPSTGVCYSFNLFSLQKDKREGIKLMTTTAGPMEALTLELDIESNLFL